MSKIKCSVPILTLNSGKYLERCLESVKDFEEIILLDGNSTDNTLEIGRKYGAKIFPQQDTAEKNVVIEDFSAMRIKSVNLTSLPWILYLDSDEYISPELAEEVRKITSENALESMAKIVYSAYTEFFISGRHFKYYYNYPASNTTLNIRLYNKASGIIFKSGKVVHEKLFVPSDIKLEWLKGKVFSEWQPLKEGIKKDNYYISLFKKKHARGHGFLLGGNAMLHFKPVFINVVAIFSIFFKVILIHLRYGFKDVLPISYNWRFIRYHLILTWLRLRKLFS